MKKIFIVGIPRSGTTLTESILSTNQNIFSLGESDLLAKLSNENAHHRTVFKAMKNLMAIRKAQSAFHPNATQYTLHLSEGLFGFWRQSINRSQSMFCVYNISDETQTLTLADLNLIGTEQWRDLISGEQITEQTQTLSLTPYQAVWLSNK